MEDIKVLQKKILEIGLFIDKVCRENNITYYIMSGTALGAVRHGGFIPWDDDLDIFMTPVEYEKFRKVFYEINDPKYVIQEWRDTPDYLRHAKVRMNGTTFIEEAYKDNKELHQGIFVDIMFLHKIPDNKFEQKKVYLESKYATLYCNMQNGWKPKTKVQALCIAIARCLPNKLLLKKFYKDIYKYDYSNDPNLKWCYWITYGGFDCGLFEPDYFAEPVDTPFEDAVLWGPTKIKEYLTLRFGDYMKLPPVEKRGAKVHAYIYDTTKDYKEYIK